MKSTLKYLDTFSEREIPRGLYRETFFPKKEKRYDHCGVIPLYGETFWLEEGLPSLLKAANKTTGNTLLIAVINRHELSEDWVRLKNIETLDYFNAFPQTRFPDTPLMTLTEYAPRLDLILLNHNEEPNLFSSKEGVGKARKLGCDLALALSTTSVLNCRYIHTTDGDAIVDEDYFSMESTSTADVLLHPYNHIGDYEQMKALKLYEQSLRYYVAGLKYANSPYAHESLGSTIAITPKCYAAVRGFPKRNAAEDFYLLNKAVKVGRLEQSTQGRVTLVGRHSDRVPFGTGVGTDKIHQKLLNKLPVTFYHPSSFDVIKNVNETFSRWSDNTDIIPNRTSITKQVRGNVSIEDLAQLESLLDSLGFFKVLKTAKEERHTPQAVLKHLHESWDGFKTLKLIHGLRDYFLPELPPESCYQPEHGVSKFLSDF